MKAYAVYVDDSDKGSGIVFAETANKARQLAQFTYACEDESYIDIKAKRIPELDGMEDEEPKDNLWLNDKIRSVLVREYDWSCLYPDKKECRICAVREECSGSRYEE